MTCTTSASGKAKLEPGRNSKAQKWKKIKGERMGKSSSSNSQSSNYVFCCFKGTKAISRNFLIDRKEKPNSGNSSSTLIISAISGVSKWYLSVCMLLKQWRIFPNFAVLTGKGLLLCTHKISNTCETGSSRPVFISSFYQIGNYFTEVMKVLALAQKSLSRVWSGEQI